MTVERVRDAGFGDACRVLEDVVLKDCGGGSARLLVGDVVVRAFPHRLLVVSCPGRDELEYVVVDFEDNPNFEVEVVGRVSVPARGEEVPVLTGRRKLRL